MLDDVKLEETSVVANVASKITKPQVNAVDVFLKIVLISQGKAALGADFLGVLVVSFDVVLQLVDRQANFVASRDFPRTSQTWSFIGMEKRYVVLQSRGSFQ